MWLTYLTNQLTNYKGKVPYGHLQYIPLLRGKQEQQRFTMRSDVSTSIITRQHITISGHPLPTLSEPYIRRPVGSPRTGDAAQDVHVTPGFGP